MMVVFEEILVIITYPQVAVCLPLI